MTPSPSRGRIASSPSKTRRGSSASKTNAGMSSSLSHTTHRPETSTIPEQDKHDLSASPARHAHPASRFSQISSTDTISPSLSPSSSHFTVPDDDKGAMDVPTVRVHNPSARHSYTASADEGDQHRDHEDISTLRPSHASPPSRPIRIRHSTRPRPRSYHDILEDFQVHARGESVASSVAASSLGAVAEERPSRLDARGHEEMQHEGEETHNITESQVRLREPIPRYTYERREDTARKKKRFSLPAVAVQTVPVVARSVPTQGGWGGVGRRLSLVLGARAIGSSGKGKGRDGSTHSSLRDDQGVGTSSRQDKASKGGESSAARALMDVLRGRRGKDKDKA